MSMAQQPTLILHPDRPAEPRKPSAEIPAYAVTAQDGVGALAPGSLHAGGVALLDINSQRWAFLPDGRALVLASLAVGEGKFWVERALLAEDTFPATVGAIDVRAEQDEKNLLAAFWEKRREMLRSMNPVVVAHEMPGATVKGEIVVPPGSYPQVRLLEKRLLDSQLCPFSVMIKVGSTNVAIVPDSLFGTDDETAEAASEQGLGQPVPAAKVMEVFAAAPPLIRAHVPQTAWLTDSQIHYVSPEWMGAVCVLQRLPASEAEVTKAAEQDPDLYAACLDNAGVRFGDHIFCLLSYQGTGTEYHEAMHKLSHRAMRDVLGQSFNEGVTEYFTRLVIEELSKSGQLIRDDGQYGAQRDAVTALLTHAVTADELAAAYFTGQLQPLYDGFARATKGALSLDGFAARLGSRTADAAAAILQEASTT